MSLDTTEHVPPVVKNDDEIEVPQENSKETNHSSNQSSRSESSRSDTDDDFDLNVHRKVEVSKIQLSDDETPKETEKKTPRKSPSPFPDIPDSVIPETLDDVLPIKGLSDKALFNLSKYNSTNEKMTIQDYIAGISGMEGALFDIEKVKVPGLLAKDFADEVKNLTKSYISLNLKGRGVMFISKNYYRVHALSLAAVGAGMYVIHMNPSTPMVSLVEAVKQSGAAQIVCDLDNKDYVVELMKYTKLPCLLINGVMNDGFVNYDDFKKIADSVDDAKIDEFRKQAKPTDIAEIVFSYAENGIRGTMWTHGNIIAQCCALKSMFNLTNKDRYIMCHNMSYYVERLFSLYLPIMVGYHVYISTDVLYRENLKYFIEIAKKFKPTILVGVPRLYEKLLFRINEALKKSKLAAKVKDLAVDGMVKQEEGKSKPVGYGTSRTLVFNKGKEKTGVIDVRYFICAGILNQNMLKDIMGKGIEVFCGLPFIETTGFIALNREKCLQLESVGKVIPGCEISVQNKMLMCSGPTISGGYTVGEIGEHFNTECEATLNNDFVEIKQYKNTAIMTSTGEFVSYKFVESLVKSITVIKGVLIAGNDKPYLSCILNVVYAKAKDVLKEKCPTEKMLARDAYFGTFIRQRIDWLNKQLPKPLQIKRFGVMVDGQPGTDLLKENMSFEDQKVAIVKFQPFIDKLYVRGIVEKEGKASKTEKEEQKKRRKAEKEREKEERKQAKAEKKLKEKDQKAEKAMQ
ncbi:AMP dependent ligase/synthetase, putative, partial [Entamoeba invadens IP1]